MYDMIWDDIYIYIDRQGMYVDTYVYTHLDEHMHISYAYEYMLKPFYVYLQPSLGECVYICIYTYIYMYTCMGSIGAYPMGPHTRRNHIIATSCAASTDSNSCTDSYEDPKLGKPSKPKIPA